MAELHIPELELIRKKLDELTQAVSNLAATVTNNDSNDESWVTGPDMRHRLRCGPDRLQQLVRDDIVERSDAFGKHPRYRMKIVA